MGKNLNVRIMQLLDLCVEFKGTLYPNHDCVYSSTISSRLSIGFEPFYLLGEHFFHWSFLPGDLSLLLCKRRLTMFGNNIIPLCNISN